ncbi:hypothetical protein STEG23_021013 [Scotinomys teguina]
MTVTPLGWDQDCSLKIREPEVLAPWFLDPGSWSKIAAVSLYFIFPGICTLSLCFMGKESFFLSDKSNLDGFVSGTLLLFPFPFAPMHSQLAYLDLSSSTFNQQMASGPEALESRHPDIENLFVDSVLQD